MRFEVGIFPFGKRKIKPCLFVCNNIYVCYKLPLKHLELNLHYSSLSRVYPWLRGLGYTSLTVFLMGFFLWNVDNIFCDKLR